MQLLKETFSLNPRAFEGGIPVRFRRTKMAIFIAEYLFITFDNVFFWMSEEFCRTLPDESSCIFGCETFSSDAKTRFLVGLRASTFKRLINACGAKKLT